MTIEGRFANHPFLQLVELSGRFDPLARHLL
jgi:hypothetical protein